jgi:hypothetical protein
MKTKRVRKTQVNGLVRYPGGKGKLCKDIIPRLQRMLGERGADAEFREPFLGSGIDSRRSPSIRPHCEVADRADGVLTCECFIGQPAIEPGTVNNGPMAYVG